MRVFLALLLILGVGSLFIDSDHGEIEMKVKPHHIISQVLNKLGGGGLYLDGLYLQPDRTFESYDIDVENDDLIHTLIVFNQESEP
jgi:hypothetical protein